MANSTNREIRFSPGSAPPDNNRSSSPRINIDGGNLLIGLNLLHRFDNNTDMVARANPFTENLRRHPRQAAPTLLDVHGVGVHNAAMLLVAAGDNPERLKSEAAFALLCGVAPLEASSGKVTRHRLNRGGNRQANHALYHVVISRLSSDPETKRYVERRTKEGKSVAEIVRVLKRYVAREVFKHLQTV